MTSNNAFKLLGKRKYTEAFGKQVLASKTDVNIPEQSDGIESQSSSCPSSQGRPDIIEQESAQRVEPSARDTPKHTCCFGTLDEIAVRFRASSPIRKPELGPTRLGGDGESYYTLQTVWNEDHAMIRSYESSYIGLLNSETFNDLLSVSRIGSIWFELVLSERVLKAVLSSSSMISPGLVIRANYNIYGDLGCADVVAKELSQRQLFLQDPNIVADGLQYDNPQSLKLLGQFSTATGSQVLPHNVSNSFEYDELMRNGNSDEITNASQQAMAGNGIALHNLIDHIPQHKHLPQAYADSRIRTTLFEYQREGLGFLLRRESLSDANSLWDLDDVRDIMEGNERDREPRYRHLITGVQNPTAEDIRGGILADDMGLGKTLMVISTIIATTALAADFAFSMTRAPRVDQEAIIAAKSTLIIVPSVLLIDTWIHEVCKHTLPGAVSHHVYHGQNRKRSLIELLNHDIMLTTYGTVVADYKSNEKFLFTTQWYRLVLDEAHVIRNATTVQFHAVSSISSYIRWCLSGTPIQNSLDDLGSLVTYLQLPILREAVQFKRYMTRQNDVKSRHRQPDLRNLQLLLASICLRRPKSILSFSEPEEQVHWIRFTGSERQGYHLLEKALEQAIELAINGHHRDPAYRKVIEILLRMRVYCNHTNCFMKLVTGVGRDMDELGSILQQTGTNTCHYCSCDVLSFGPAADKDNGTITICERAICADCTTRYVEEVEIFRNCPVCKQHHVKAADVMSDCYAAELARIEDLPSKIQRLCQDLEDHRRESKSVVFSFWQKSLDIVCYALDRTNIPYLRVDGSMPPHERKRALSQFEIAEVGTTLLMTLGTGAVGLNNLMVANRVHILEPQWNPFVENQAIGRIARIGQTKTVHVIRYIVSNTVEGKVHGGQLQKLYLASSGFGNSESMSTKQKAQALTSLVRTNMESTP